MVAWDDSTSMDWARVMRGTSSMEIMSTPAEATCSNASKSFQGESRPTSKLPAAICSRIVFSGRRTHKSTVRSEEHTSELQSRGHLVCRLLLEKKKSKQS